MRLSFILKPGVWLLVFISLGHFLMFASHDTASMAGGEIGRLIKGNKSFCFDLYRQLKKEEGNLFFSPYSISSAMAMTYAGARGMTEKEMARVLHFALAQNDLHPTFSELAVLIGKNREREGVELRIANALWIQKDFRLKEGFLNITDLYYGAASFRVDFVPTAVREKTRRTINQWVEKQTAEKIKNLVPKRILTSLTRLVMTNAIYFKGDWETCFNESHTRNAPFFASPQRKIEIPMMYLEDSFSYLDDGTIQVLQMPYKGGEISMLIVLPRQNFGIEKVEQELDNDRLNLWLAGLNTRKVKVFLPRFKMTCKYEMKGILTAMGMRSAFSSANFSGIADVPLPIDEVLHKAFLEVNERGTEAAAATAVVMGRGTVKPEIPVFRADHPFIFLIRDNNTGTIMFMGRIWDPS